MPAIPLLPGLSPVAARSLTATFDAGRLSSDGGLIVLREIASRLGLVQAIAARFPDDRDSTRVLHSYAGAHAHDVKTQIWIAVSVHILIAIVKKRLSCSASLYEMLQILSLTMFERTSINQLLSQQPQVSHERVSPNQLSFFE
jgi:hypothetical protein